MFDPDQWAYMRGKQRSVEVPPRQRISWSWAEEQNSWSLKGSTEAMCKFHCFNDPSWISGIWVQFCDLNVDTEISSGYTKRGAARTITP